MASEQSAKETVVSFLEALNRMDLQMARGFLDDRLSFTAPDGAPVQGADAYLAGWKPLGLSYAIRKAFADGEDVCVLYDIHFSRPPVTLFACGYYQLKAGKVASIKVIFDPRPLLKN